MADVITRVESRAISLEENEFLRKVYGRENENVEGSFLEDGRDGEELVGGKNGRTRTPTEITKASFGSGSRKSVHSSSTITQSESESDDGVDDDEGSDDDNEVVVAPPTPSNVVASSGNGLGVGGSRKLKRAQVFVKNQGGNLLEDMRRRGTTESERRVRMVRDPSATPAMRMLWRQKWANNKVSDGLEMDLSEDEDSSNNSSFGSRKRLGGRWDTKNWKGEEELTRPAFPDRREDRKEDGNGNIGLQIMRRQNEKRQVLATQKQHISFAKDDLVEFISLGQARAPRKRDLLRFWKSKRVATAASAGKNGNAKAIPASRRKGPLKLLRRALR